MIPILLVGFLINLIVFFMMGIDKHKAKKGAFRISERTLLLSACCFGSIGLLLGMSCFRHKTQKMKFIILSRLFLIAHIGIILYVIMNLQSFDGILQ